MSENRASVTTLSIRVETPRLVLRAPQVSDVPELRLLLRKNASHLRAVSPLPRPSEDPSSLTELSNLVARQRREWRQDRGYSFVMALRHPDQPIIGRLALNNVIRGAFHNAYLGYWLDESHQGRGLMQEGVRHALRFGFEVLKLHRVQIAIMPRNTRSLRVMERLGIRREGLAKSYLCIAGKWEDHEIFAVTVDDRLSPDPHDAAPEIEP